MSFSQKGLRIFAAITIGVIIFLTYSGNMVFNSYSSIVNFNVTIERARVKAAPSEVTIEANMILQNRGVFKLKLDYIYLNVRLDNKWLTDPKRPPFISGQEVSRGEECIMLPNENKTISASFSFSVYKDLKLSGSEKWMFIVWITLSDVPIYGRQMIERHCIPSMVEYP